MSAYKHLDQFRGEARISTWLTAIVSNSALMQLRWRPRYQPISLDEPVGEDQEFTLSEQLADEGPNSRGRMPKLTTHCSGERAAATALALTPQGI